MKPHVSTAVLKKTDASDSERMKLTGFRVEENHCLVYHRFMGIHSAKHPKDEWTRTDQADQAFTGPQNNVFLQLFC